MSEKIYESTEKVDGKFKLECSECYYPDNLLENPEKEEVFECRDCGSPFTIVDVSEDKVRYKAVVFDEEEWRE